MIDRVPEIDIFSALGDSPNTESGQVEFQNVEFFYPSRPDVQVKCIDEIRCRIEPISEYLFQILASLSLSYFSNYKLVDRGGLGNFGS